MVKPVPSLMLLLDVDQPLVSQETRLEINRCWAHVSPTVLRGHETPEGEQPENIARFLVKFGTNHYLKSSFAGADETWNDTMEHWLYSMFHKVGNNMKIFNRRQREEHLTELYFDKLEVNMEDDAAIVTVRLDSQSDIVPETAYMITHVREALNAGLLGEGPVRVLMPSEASWKAQLEAAAEEAARKEAERLAAEEAERLAAEEAAQAAIEEAEEDFAPAPDLVEPDPEELDEARIRAELEARWTLPEADFAVDYSRWDVTFPDGSVREFDASTMQFV